MCDATRRLLSKYMELSFRIVLTLCDSVFSDRREMLTSLRM